MTLAEPHAGAVAVKVYTPASPRTVDEIFAALVVLLLIVLAPPVHSRLYPPPPDTVLVILMVVPAQTVAGLTVAVNVVGNWLTVRESI